MRNRNDVFHSPTVVVCQGCYNKVPHTGGLKQPRCIVTQFWTLDFQDQGVKEKPSYLASGDLLTVFGE